MTSERRRVPAGLFILMILFIIIHLSTQQGSLLIRLGKLIRTSDKLYWVGKESYETRIFVWLTFLFSFEERYSELAQICIWVKSNEPIYFFIGLFE